MHAVPTPKPQKKPVASVVELSWQRADDLLLANDKNRNVNDATVKRFRQIIHSGQWVLSNDAVVVDRTGFVRNGQHRLHAISDLRATVPVMLLEGVDPNDRWQYDQGRKRGAADVLAMHGKQGADRHVAITRRMFTGPSKQWTVPQAVAVALTVWPSVQFAVHQLDRHKADKNLRGLANSGFGGALARAHAASVDVETLMRFSEIVLHDGIGRRFNDRDVPLRWLRDHILGEWNRNGQRIDQTQCFWTAQTVLHHWFKEQIFNPELDPVRSIHLFTGPKLKLKGAL